jgi:hypothetical protein
LAAQQAQSQKEDAMGALQGLKTATEADKNTDGKLSQGLSDVLGGGEAIAAA